MTRAAKAVAITMIAGTVAGCADLLPRSGPNKREIYAGSVMQEGDAFIVSVNKRVTTAAGAMPGRGFSAAFRNAGPLGADTVRPGDTLGLVIYENVEDGLLASGGSAAAGIDEVQVDSQGFIFVPYAGRIRAAGNTPEALRRVITARLDEQTPDPQVVVRRLAGDGATVSVIGSGGGQGVVPIERPTRTLIPMLAAAGGIGALDPETAKVTVVRGHRSESVFFKDLIEHPSLDIALRDGDRIFVEDDTRAFTVLGATGAQSLIEFDSQTVTAIEALAQVGGLNPTLANPTGVFVFRDENQAVAREIMGRADLEGPQRVVYVLDLTKPNGMFDARDFQVRDGDTIYVTEAPIVSFNRSVAAIFGTLGNASALASTVGVE